MSTDPTLREQLERAMAALDSQRDTLGDAAVEAALAGLRQKLATLEGDAAQPPTPLEGERRVISMLFCDVKGSTSMAEKLDPEEWAGIMKRAFAYLIPPVSRHGGTVARLMGDAILAFFGAPTAHEDDPQRAVLAGLEIVDGSRSLRAQLQQERGLDFNVRVGINTGLVLVGAIGSGQRVEYTAMGDAMNVGARMEQTAKPGTLQISGATQRLVAPLFEFEDLGGVEVKGKSEPVPAFRVLGLKRKPGGLRGLAQQGIQAPLVGRSAERAQLEACLARLAQGQGVVVAILGEAGLGKSRLIAEFRDWRLEISETAAARIENHQSPISNLQSPLWLEGHTLSFGRTISYWPFQEIVRHVAGGGDEENEDAVWQKLEAMTAGLFVESAGEVLPYLASLLGLEVREPYAERVKHLDGEAMGTQIFFTLRHFFERLARRQPLVLVFDDLHWIDDSSLGLLEHILPLVESVPLLVIVLSRPGSTGVTRVRDLAAREFPSRYSEINLAPLSDADSAHLLDLLLAIEDMPLPTRRLILDKADGNPYFLEEVIRMLIDSGAVLRDAGSGRWRTTARIESLDISDTVQGLIMARVDRLDEQVKHVLRMAAVIGRTFIYRVLSAITEADLRLDEHLAELQQVELIREKQSEPELEYMFKHALAQEATYESILLATRRELHARVGRALESLFADRLDEMCTLLAYHYSKAEQWARAQEFLLRAGDQAGRLAADAEALAHYRQAMAAYARAFGDRWDAVERSELHRKMGDALYRRGESAQALESFGQALAALGQPLPPSKRALERGLALDALRQVMHQARPRRLAVPQIKDGAQRERMAQIIEVLKSMGWATVSTDPNLFVWAVLRSLNLAEQAGLTDDVAWSSASLAFVLDVMQQYGLAEHYHNRALALSRRTDRLDVSGLTYQMLTLHAFYQARWEDVETYGRRASEIWRATGELHGLGWVSVFRAYSHARQGRFREALALGEAMINVGRDGADPVAQLQGLDVAGVALLTLGDTAKAVPYLEEAIRLARETSDYLDLSRPSVTLSRWYVRNGDWQRALTILEETRRMLRQHDVREPIANSLTASSLATACMLAAEQRAGPERSAWLRRAGQHCADALRRSRRLPAERIEALRVKGSYEFAQGRPASARSYWQQSRRTAEEVSMRYDAALTQWEMGRRLNEPTHCAPAERLLRELGANLDAEAASAWLAANGEVRSNKAETGH
jgi:class 3 adenylate cyclase/tetratricopeptide (TPR) repeat protein